MRELQKIICIIVFVSFYSCKTSEKNGAEIAKRSVVSKYAEILKTPESNIKNIKLYTFIDDWYGVRYKYGGMSKSGVDCSGFCNLLYNSVYRRQIERTTKELSKSINKRSKNNLQEGDLIFFNISGKKNSHVGVYLTNDMFVHASTSKGVLISSLKNPYYIKTYSKGGKP